MRKRKFSGTMTKKTAINTNDACAVLTISIYRTGAPLELTNRDSCLSVARTKQSNTNENFLARVALANCFVVILGLH